MKYKKYIYLLSYTLLVSYLTKSFLPNHKVAPTVVYKTIRVPTVEYLHDTVKVFDNTSLRKVKVDTVLYYKYTSEEDVAIKDSIFKESIFIREYNQSFEDSVQTVDVYSKVRGTLLEQSLKYKTKPYQITLKDTVFLQPKSYLSAGIELGLPTTPSVGTSPDFKGNVSLTNKRGNSFSVSFDTNGRFWVGKQWKIKLKR
jgi:hypothetical protein